MRLASFTGHDNKDVIVNADQVVFFRQFNDEFVMLHLASPQGEHQLLVRATLLQVAGKLEGSQL